MAMLPKGFGRMLEQVKLPYDIPARCTMAICPTCNNLFARDEDHKVCNYCVNGVVMIKDGKFNYYEGLDQSKQNKFDV